MQKRVKAVRRPDADRPSRARNPARYATTVVGRNQRGLCQVGRAIRSGAPWIRHGPIDAVVAYVPEEGARSRFLYVVCLIA